MLLFYNCLNSKSCIFLSLSCTLTATWIRVLYISITFDIKPLFQSKNMLADSRYGVWSVCFNFVRLFKLCTMCTKSEFLRNNVSKKQMFSAIWQQRRSHGSKCMYIVQRRIKLWWRGVTADRCLAFNAPDMSYGTKFSALKTWLNCRVKAWLILVPSFL